jgi:hypothetical protein
MLAPSFIHILLIFI